MTTPDWLRSAMKMPVTVYRREASGTDEYGNITYTETTTTGTCFVQPVSQQEIQDGRAEVGAFLAHFSTDLIGTLNGFARLEIAGMSYEAVGPPAVFPDPDTGAPHHVEMYVVASSA